MKFLIPKSQISGLEPSLWIRRTGYALIYNSQTKQESFVRRIGRDFYPRFHLYIKELNEKELLFNLHLDQKKASYAGFKRHNAEYDGELVEREMERIKSFLVTKEESEPNSLTKQQEALAKKEAKGLRAWWQKLKF